MILSTFALDTINNIELYPSENNSPNYEPDYRQISAPQSKIFKFYVCMAGLVDYIIIYVLYNFNKNNFEVCNLWVHITITYAK